MIRRDAKIEKKSDERRDNLHISKSSCIHRALERHSVEKEEVGWRQPGMLRFRVVDEMHLIRISNNGT